MGRLALRNAHSFCNSTHRRRINLPFWRPDIPNNAVAKQIVRAAIDQRTGSRVELQCLVYTRIREQFRLPAQLVVGAIGKASKVYKALGDLADHPVFLPESAVIYNRRILCISDLVAVSLSTIQGRIVVPFVGISVRTSMQIQNSPISWCRAGCSTVHSPGRYPALSHG